MKAFGDCPGTKTGFLVRKSQGRNIHQTLKDGKVWDIGNQWVTVCTRGAHARCISCFATLSCAGSGVFPLSWKLENLAVNYCLTFLESRRPPQMLHLCTVFLLSDNAEQHSSWQRTTSVVTPKADWQAYWVCYPCMLPNTVTTLVRRLNLS